MPDRSSPRRTERARKMQELREAFVRAAGNAAKLAELRAELAALKRPTPMAIRRMDLELWAIASRLDRVRGTLAEVGDEIAHCSPPVAPPADDAQTARDDDGGEDDE